MANFQPLKNYLLVLVEQLIEDHGLKGPFLDAGCGQGELAFLLAEKGWQGKAIDLSRPALEKTRQKLAPFQKRVSVQEKDLFQVKAKFQTIFLLDVLEHIKEDQKLIKQLRKSLRKKGHLLISVPVHPREWRWDDDFYGHFRRYQIKEIKMLLEKNGFSVLEIWDFTFPVFWFLRRVYTRLIFPKNSTSNDRKTATLESTLQNAWGQGVLNRWSRNLFWESPVFWLQKKFKNRLWGCECVILAKVKS